MSWDLEKRIIETRPGSFVTGVEKNKVIHDHSKKAAPARSVLLHDDVFDVIAGDIRPNWNAFWLDVYGCGSDKARKSLPHICEKLDAAAVAVPFAITFFIGRESPDTTGLLRLFKTNEPRAALLVWLLESSGHRRVVSAKIIRYGSTGVVTGKLVRQSSTPRKLIPIKDSYVMIDEDDIGVLNGAILVAQNNGLVLDALLNNAAGIIQSKNGFIPKPGFRKDSNKHNLCRQNLHSSYSTELTSRNTSSLTPFSTVKRPRRLVDSIQ